MLACDARNDAPHLWAADVCGLVVAGAREWHGRPWFSCGHENRAGVYAFVSMPDKCVSFAPVNVDGKGRNQAAVVNDGCIDARCSERL